jgi:hypothetical protein
MTQNFDMNRRETAGFFYFIALIWRLLPQIS